MDLFTFCLKVLSLEQQKFGLKLKAADFAQFSNLDANFNLVQMRCAYMYKYGTSTLYLKHDLIKNVFLHPGKSFQISKVLSKWEKCMELKLSSFSSGPGLEIIAFMLALAKDSFLPAPFFKHIKIISKYGAWRNTVKLMLDVIEENTLVDFPTTLINKDIVEVIQGDIVSSFTLKVKTGISNSNVILMMKALNLTSENEQQEHLNAMLLDFISFLNEEALIFCIDTKPSVNALTKVLAQFPGNYFVEPEHFSRKIPIAFPEIYKIFYGLFPSMSARGAFFVWQKLALPPSSAIPLVSSDLSSYNLPMAKQEKSSLGMEENEFTNKTSPLRNYSQDESQNIPNSVFDGLKNQDSPESTTRVIKNQCTVESIIGELKNNSTSESKVGDVNNQCTFKSSIAFAKHCESESIPEDLKQLSTSESNFGKLFKYLCDSSFEDFSNECKSESTVGALNEQCIPKSTDGDLKGQSISELTVKDFIEERTFESTDELKEQSVSKEGVSDEDRMKKCSSESIAEYSQPTLESNLLELSNQHTPEAVVGNSQLTLESNLELSHCIPESAVGNSQPTLESNLLELSNQCKPEFVVGNCQPSLESNLLELSYQGASESVVENFSSVVTDGALKDSVSKTDLNSSKVTTLKKEDGPSTEPIMTFKTPNEDILADSSLNQNKCALKNNEDGETVLKTERQHTNGAKPKHKCIPKTISVFPNISGTVRKETEKNAFVKDEIPNEKSNSNNVKVIDVLLRLKTNQSSIYQNIPDKEIKILKPNTLNSEHESTNVMVANMEELYASGHQVRSHLNEISKGLNKNNETFCKSDAQNNHNIVAKDAANEIKNTNVVVESTNMRNAPNDKKTLIENNFSKKELKPAPIIGNSISSTSSMNDLKLQENLINAHSNKLCNKTIVKNGHESTPENFMLSKNNNSSNSIQQQTKILDHFENDSNNLPRLGHTGNGTRKKSSLNEVTSTIGKKNQSVQTDLISNKIETFQRIETLRARIKQLTSTLEQLNLREKCHDSVVECPAAKNVACLTSKNNSNDITTSCAAFQDIEKQTSAECCSTQEVNCCARAKSTEVPISNSEHHCCNLLPDMHQSCKCCRFFKIPEQCCRSCAVSSDVKQCNKYHKNMHCYSSPLYCYRNTCCPFDRMPCRNACHGCHSRIQYPENSCHCTFNSASQRHNVPVNEDYNLLKGNFECCKSQSYPAYNANENSLGQRPQIVIPLENISGDVLTQILKLLNQTKT